MHLRNFSQNISIKCQIEYMNHVERCQINIITEFSYSSSAYQTRTVVLGNGNPTPDATFSNQTYINTLLMSDLHTFRRYMVKSIVQPRPSFGWFRKKYKKFLLGQQLSYTVQSHIPSTFIACDCGQKKHKQIQRYMKNISPREYWRCENGDQPNN